MNVFYKLVVSDLEVREYGDISIDVSKRIYFKANIDNIEKDVTLSWLKVLLSHKENELHKQLCNLKDNISKEIENYAKSHNYNIKKWYTFDYDSNLCICIVCDSPNTKVDDNICF